MSRQSQRESVLNRLKQGPATTWQLGYGLNICCVTKRISELREEYGYDSIVTTKEKRNDRWVFIYTLKSQAELPLEGAA